MGVQVLHRVQEPFDEEIVNIHLDFGVIEGQVVGAGETFGGCWWLFLEGCSLGVGHHGVEKPGPPLLHKAEERVAISRDLL